MLRARVVSRREESRVAVAVTSFAASVLLLVLLDDVVKLRLLPGAGTLAYAFVTAMIALAGVGPWLAWTRRGDLANVAIAPGRVVASDAVFTSGDVTGVAVATGARGKSVAIAGAGGHVSFLEVESEADADAIADALGRKRAASATLPLRAPSRRLSLWQAMLSWTCFVCAPLYFLSATAELSGNGKATYGITGVVAAVASAAFLLVRHLLRTQAVAVRRGAYDAHVALHRDAPIAADERAAPAEGERAPHVLERGHEPVRAWLARLDALPMETHAYRGDAMKKDVLWQTLSDDHASLETRMGAARVLAKRHGEEPEALVRVVEDPDVRVRVEAALDEEEEDAERRIEKLGPLFRAR